MIAAIVFQVKSFLLKGPLTNRCNRFWHDGMCFEFYLANTNFSNHKKLKK